MPSNFFFRAAFLSVGFVSSSFGECLNGKTLHPEWIFCDDFEDTSALVRAGRYFEHNDNGGEFVPQSGAGYQSSRGMRVHFQQGEVGAGSLALAFGRNPNAYMNKQNIRSTGDFRDIYYRMYLKMQKGWQGQNPAKLSRATVFTSAADWSQAMIAHLWSDNSGHLLIDPASCVDNASQVLCQGYNDFAHLMWLGNKSGVTPVFSAAGDDRWYCVEAHVKLNDPGQSNGIQEFWIDGYLEARQINLNFVKSYTNYAINAVFFENYWNSGSVQEQERYFDNIVVSTQPVGCLNSSSGIRRGFPPPLKPFAWRLGPSPFRPPARLWLEGAGATPEQISIYDLAGKRVSAPAVADLGSGRFAVSWTGHGYPAGTYFLRVGKGNEAHMLKFILVQ